MEFQLKKAQRSRAKLKIGITAPSGGGKTYSALQFAAGLTGGNWEKVCVIDTERSAELYADNEGFGPYNVITLDAPHNDERYLGALRSAIKAGMDVVIIDSMSHFWSWVLEYQGKQGGRFQDWAKANIPYQRVIDAILTAPVHIICTTRRKVEYEISNEGQGKAKVTKVGMKQEFRESFEYELSVVFGLNQNHLAYPEKDRTGLFAGKPDFLISQETGKLMLDWTNSAVCQETYTTADLNYVNTVEAVLQKRDLAHLKDSVLAYLEGKTRKKGGVDEAIKAVQIKLEHPEVEEIA